jgi:hypothetical protein
MQFLPVLFVLGIGVVFILFLPHDSCTGWNIFSET